MYASHDQLSSILAWAIVNGTRCRNASQRLPQRHPRREPAHALEGIPNLLVYFGHVPPPSLDPSDYVGVGNPCGRATGTVLIEQGQALRQGPPILVDAGQEAKEFGTRECTAPDHEVLATRVRLATCQALRIANVPVGDDRNTDGLSCATDRIPVGSPFVELVSGSSMDRDPSRAPLLHGLGDVIGFRCRGPTNADLGRYRYVGRTTHGLDDPSDAPGFTQQRSAAIVAIDPPHGATEVQIDGSSASPSCVPGSFGEQVRVPTQQLRLDEDAGRRDAASNHLGASSRERMRWERSDAHPRIDAHTPVDPAQRGEYFPKDGIGDALQGREKEPSGDHEQADRMAAGRAERQTGRRIAQRSSRSLLRSRFGSARVERPCVKPSSSARES